ncbi:hypothetical protein Tsubulata_012619 [Turnera subulata]|uniref:RRM domain-containing protein n=1 Tax=Turnera subulata TaxID=218843 RepID=A0A9Q0FM90_9ROSI|nr:hypothetical protein Tsubulata_012619 [Turnera subulata]
MGRSGRDADRHGKSSSEVSGDQCYDGTAARTRPYSYDEIMSNRKNKKVAENEEGGGQLGGALGGDGVADKVSDLSGPERGNGDGKNSPPGVRSSSVGEQVKEGSRKEEEKGSVKDDELTKHEEKKAQHSGRHDKDHSPGVRHRLSEERVRSVKNGEHSSRKDGYLGKYEDREGHDSERRGKNHSSSAQQRLPKERVKGSSRKKESSAAMEDACLSKHKNRDVRDSETKMKDRLSKDLRADARGRTDEKIHDRRRRDERLSKNSENEDAKKRPRDLVEKDRHVEPRRLKSEITIGEKYHNKVDEKDRDRNGPKAHDLGKGRNLETLERRERKESTKSHHEESRMKRRRSRSRERGGRGRRSISLSPRAHKRVSHHGKTHDEPPSHSLKGRSGREHSDADRSKMIDNGSSSHYRRHTGSSSGLGGYSPRKRRSEAAVKTPSPTKQSPEKKRPKWDLAPKGTDNNFPDIAPPNVQVSNQSALPNIQQMVSVIPTASTAAKHLSGISAIVSQTFNNNSIDSVQLTQATRPMRRLYVENIPASASEKAVMEWLNNFLISSGVNRIPGSLPCISCIIHKEKSQALVEFLTPEDASAAISFDGTSFSGSIIRIRRPKDYVEVAFHFMISNILDFWGQRLMIFKLKRCFQTVAIFMQTAEPERSLVAEQSVIAVDTVSDNVKDSPHKIFIGGISKILTSKMLMEIASAFGPLKAYQFENGKDLTEPCAFLEYADQSITHKACAGLNGMKLGGQVITAVQAIQYTSSLEQSGGNSLVHGIPEHAKPLLEKPTEVLKLKNVFDPAALSLLTRTEIEETLEDARLECVRYGTVKSVKLVEYGANPISEACEVSRDMGSNGGEQDLKPDQTSAKTETVTEAVDRNIMEGKGTCQPSGYSNDVAVDNLERSSLSNCQELPKQQCTSEDELGCNVDKVIVEAAACRNVSESDSQEHAQQQCTSKDELGCKDGEAIVEDPASTGESESEELPQQQHNLMDELDDSSEKLIDIKNGGISVDCNFTAEKELNSAKANGQCEEGPTNDAKNIASDAIEKVESEKQGCNLEAIFEPGCVFVEFGRVESSCTAAHSLHGRLFDDRAVMVEYVPLDLYRARFPNRVGATQ